MKVFFKRENLCASCARICECSVCRPQQGEKITFGITSVSHVRRDYSCSTGYCQIFPRFRSYFWGRSKWTSFKTPTNPLQIRSIKKGFHVEGVVHQSLRMCVCIFFHKCYPLWLQDATADPPSTSTCLPRPVALELVVTLKIQKMVCGKGEGGGVREGVEACSVDERFTFEMPHCAAQSKENRLKFKLGSLHPARSVFRSVK